MNNSTRLEVVSSDDEPLILVDSDDQQIGTLDKSTCHDGDGTLHRAFSLFVFNSRGETLLQRRHSAKRLWPGYWSNGCCSHPRNGESINEAVVRRASQELGLSVDPCFLFKFQYKASFLDIGTEFELCSVFVSHTDEAPLVNATEIEDWQWVTPSDLDKKISTQSSALTPWLRIEWERLRAEFRDQIRPPRAV
ncbi:MAG: isopentenyl-diphosphate Delta-isomerase [Gammaproteobacteria bacterium]|nr:isopentenyl-diphosphate Delta-isomerase [Gammaproteobacteria bacterium]MYD80234.1 isopentenyl-diphosphate Delta-isomerase [Gammaproteobacteria bacterium]